jgi:hypothetical protein
MAQSKILANWSVRLKSEPARISYRRPDDYQRLRAFVEELRERLRQRLAARQSKEEVRVRARELWEQPGRAADRDLDGS